MKRNIGKILFRLVSIILIIATICVAALIINNNEIINLSTKKENLKALETETGTVKFDKIATTGDDKCILGIDLEGNIWTASNTPLTNFYQLTTDIKFKDVAAGYASYIALDEEGNLWTWGLKENGQLGYETEERYEHSPKKIELNTTFTKIEISKNSEGYCIAIDIEGNIWTWGTLGASGNKLKIDIPTKLTNGTIFTEISSVIGSNAAALDREGNIWTWGYNEDGRLGYTSGILQTTPRKITSTEKFKKVLSSSTVNFALDTTGNVWALGASKELSKIKEGNYIALNSDGISSLLLNNNGEVFASQQPDTTADLTDVLKLSKDGVEMTQIQSPFSLDKDNKLYRYCRDEYIIYKVILNTNGGTLKSESNILGYVYGTERILPTNIEKEGYNFAGWKDTTTNEIVTSISNTELGDKSYSALWTKDECTVTFKDEEREETQTVEYGTAATAPNWTKPGYTLTWDIEFTNVTEDITVNAIWTINEYTVTFKDRETQETQTVTHGSAATAPNWTRPGYTLTWDTEFTNVTEDITVNAIWTINEYTVTFKNGETQETQTVTHGSAATAPNWTKPGYTLTWDIEFTNVTEDITVNAIWAANQYTAYKVEYYLENLDLEVGGYNLYETINKTGTTDTTVTAEAKEYTGFTENTTYSQRKASGVVAGNGSLVLKLYYDRNVYNITYKLNGGTATNLSNNYTYGRSLILSNRVTKPGYIFLGWYDNENFNGNAVTRISETETGNKTFYAKWASEEEYYITSEKYTIDLNNNYIIKVSPYTTVTTFINKINTNGTPKVVNLRGEQITGESLVGTGYKLQTTFKGRTYEYEIGVRGDLDGNGEITVTDLSILNKVIVGNMTLNGIKKQVADIDYNNEITVTDLSMLNKAIVGKQDL